MMEVEVMHADGEEIGLMIVDGETISTVYLERHPQLGYHVTSQSTWSVDLVNKMFEMVRREAPEDQPAND